jgi:hypothetical protein
MPEASRGPRSAATGRHAGPRRASFGAVAGRADPAGELSRRVLIAETEPVTERVPMREIDDDEGWRRARIVRRGSGSVMTWRRAQMVLLSAQGMGVAAIAEVAFTSQDRVALKSYSA